MPFCKQNGKVVHSALPARLLVDDTHAYILTNCDRGNSVSAPGVGGKVPLMTLDLGRQPKSFKCSPHLKVAIRLFDARQFLIKQILIESINNKIDAQKQHIDGED